jgi:hypothetical protein
MLRHTNYSANACFVRRVQIHVVTLPDGRLKLPYRKNTKTNNKRTITCNSSEPNDCSILAQFNKNTKLLSIYEGKKLNHISDRC